MNGIDSFRDWFAGFNQEYVIIGGAACDILASSAGIEARATKDIDMVLLMENMTQQFAQRFWDYIHIMGYENRYKGDGTKQCYRFTHPKNSAAPGMIELFAHHFDAFPLPEDAVITPIPLDDPLSDLSGILLDEEYYQFVATGGIEIDGVMILDNLHLIPLKAKAWLNLKAEKDAGSITVRKRDLKKHPADIIMLSGLLREDDRLQLSPSIYQDMQTFLSEIMVSEHANAFQRSNIPDRLTRTYIAAELLYT